MERPRHSGNDPSGKPRQGRAVRPRLSASLILLRGSRGAPRVLMGKRAAGHGFMPSKIVFPGGRVERSDSFAPVATPLPPESAAALGRHLRGRRAHAVAAAAIRETFEETGLMLARPVRTQKAPKGWEAFAASGLGADFGALHLIARAITPPYHHKRFDAWFFLARADDLVDLPHHNASGELEELAWLSLDEALSSDIPRITAMILDDVRRRLKQPDAPVPWYSMPRGRHRRDFL